MQNYLSIINIVKNKIPFFILTMHLLTNKYIFENCPEKPLYFWMYYPFICIICFVWEFWHAWMIYKQNYKTGNPLKFSLISSFGSLMAFIAYSIYVPGGVPFSCYFDYDSTACGLIFYMTYTIIYFMSGIEHYYWKKISDSDFQQL